MVSELRLVAREEFSVEIIILSLNFHASLGSSSQSLWEASRQASGIATIRVPIGELERSKMCICIREICGYKCESAYKHLCDSLATHFKRHPRGGTSNKVAASDFIRKRSDNRLNSSRRSKRKRRVVSRHKCRVKERERQAIHLSSCRPWASAFLQSTLRWQAKRRNKAPPNKAKVYGQL